jgi:hypothetical protein
VRPARNTTRYRVAPFTSAAVAEAGEAVKPGAGQDRAGCFQAGPPGSDALTHHESPGEQLASQAGGGVPRTPSDQQEREQLRSFSKGFAVPIEKDDMCGTTVLLRLDDGRLLARRVDCKVKACPHCGPRLRRQWAELWAAVLDLAAQDGEVVHRLVVAEAEWPKLQRRKVMRGAEYGAIPAPDGLRVVYTTAEVGELATEVTPDDLEVDFQAMPNDTRQRSLSVRWQKRADCIQVFTSPAATADVPRKVEFLGIIRTGLEHARQLAHDFGVYDEEAARDGSAFIMRQPDDALSWARFKRWAGLEEPSQAARMRRLRKPKPVAA